MGDQNFNPPNFSKMGVSAPKFAFLDQNFPRIKFLDSLKFRGQFLPPTCHDTTGLTDTRVPCNKCVASQAHNFANSLGF